MWETYKHLSFGRHIWDTARTTETYMSVGQDVNVWWIDNEVMFIANLLLGQYRETNLKI